MGQVNKRSLTLIETLIVIAILLAIGAVAVPLVTNSLDERAFESAADVTSEQLVLARAHAQSTGEAVEVRYRAGAAQVEARRFAPWLPVLAPWPQGPVGKGDSTRQEGTAAGNGANQLSVSADASAETDSVIAEAWACRSLSRGIRIVDHRPLDGSESPDRGTSVSNAESEFAASESDDLLDNDIRLAVFMPDGSALMGAPVWFNDEDGRLGRLTINPWTGMPMFERMEALNEETSVKESPDESRPELKSGDTETDAARAPTTKGKAAATDSTTPGKKPARRDHGE